jgi:hypothetical protein
MPHLSAHAALLCMAGFDECSLWASKAQDVSLPGAGHGLPFRPITQAPTALARYLHTKCNF